MQSWASRLRSLPVEVLLSSRLPTCCLGGRARYSTQLQPLPPSTPPQKRDEETREWKPDTFTPEVDVDELLSLPLLNLRALSRYKEPPRGFRALVRDFVDDSLYNPQYGYFSTQAEIVDFGVNETEGIDFHALRNETAFNNAVARKYGAMMQDVAVPGKGQDAARQVWHTPTELFKPWYARAVARYLVAEYNAALYETGEDLLIYELGAGNGTLMRGILDYLAEYEPEAYARTRYHIIEISPRLANIQRQRAERGRHAHKLTITNASIFDWRTPVQEPCYFLAFEVLDNLAHDVVRYTVEDHLPMQCFVGGDKQGDLIDYYEPVSDRLILRYLNLFQYTPSRWRAPHTPLWLDQRPRWRYWKSTLPLMGNLGPPIFIPTKALMLLDVLRDYFPRHRLCVSDFDSLPDAVEGRTAPVVQTRYKGMTIPCTTYLVTPGYFDIFFPTDFELFRDLYDLVMSPTPFSTMSLDEAAAGWHFFDSYEMTRGARPLEIATHREFLQRWAEPGCTTLRDGSDPMLEYYANAKFAFA